MTVFTFFVVFVVFAFLLNIVRPIYHYFGWQIPAYMDTGSQLVQENHIPWDLNNIHDIIPSLSGVQKYLPLNIGEGTGNLSGTISELGTTGGYQYLKPLQYLTGDLVMTGYHITVIDTGYGPVVTQGDGDISAYQHFLQEIEADLYLPKLDHAGQISQDGNYNILTDIARRETKKNQMLEQIYQQEYYHHIIKKMESLEKFFQDYNMQAEVAEIQQKIQEFKSKVPHI